MVDAEFSVILFTELVIINPFCVGFYLVLAEKGVCSFSCCLPDTLMTADSLESYKEDEMPFLFNRHRLVLNIIVIAVLLTETATFCLAGEPSADKTYKPADPREVFQKAGINSFDKGALSNIVLRGYQRENLMITFDGAPYFGSAPFRSDAPPVIINKSDISSIIDALANSLFSVFVPL